MRNEISTMNHDLRSRLCPGIKLGIKSTFIMAKTVLIRNEILIYRDLSILNWISYIETNWIRSGFELNLDLCEVPNRPARNQSTSLRSYYSCLLPRFSGLLMSRQKGVHESPRTVTMSDICEKCFSNGCIIFYFCLARNNCPKSFTSRQF